MENCFKKLFLTENSTGGNTANGDAIYGTNEESGFILAQGQFISLQHGIWEKMHTET